jgi:hypothetical protein
LPWFPRDLGPFLFISSLLFLGLDFYGSDGKYTIAETSLKLSSSNPSQAAKSSAGLRSRSKDDALFSQCCRVLRAIFKMRARREVRAYTHMYLGAN